MPTAKTATPTPLREEAPEVQPEDVQPTPIADPSYYSLKVRTEFGDVYFHVDGGASTTDIDALHQLATYQIDQLREMSTEDAGAYFMELPKVGSDAGKTAATAGVICGLCGSSNIREKQPTDHVKAPKYKCQDCYGVVWANKPGVWAQGQPPK